MLFQAWKTIKVSVMPKKTKIFVLDTNIILHDDKAIYNFQDNDIVIPITVVEELDKFKRGNDTLSYNAREFVREMDRISDNSLFAKGIPLGKGKGTVKIEIGHPFSSEISASLFDDTPDHRILATTQWLSENNKDRKVILVTKDVNLRIKAKALGIMAQDYLTDKVDDSRIETVHNEVVDITDFPDEAIEEILGNRDGVSLTKLKMEQPAANQLFKLKGVKHLVLARYQESTNSIVAVRTDKAYGIKARNNEQAFSLDAVMNPDIKLVALTGKAGTGKTLLALAGALAQEADFDQILLARPVIPLRNQDIGFLPGTADEKVGPYMLPLYDNLSVIKKQTSSTSKENVKIEDMLRREKLVISQLAYIRGRSLNNVFFIVDEAQNLTPHEVKTIITRAGEGTKIVFTGDIFQIDSPYLDINSNGLTHIVDKMYGQPLFQHVNLIKGERSELSELAGRLL